MGGLFAARVLSYYYKQVTVIDRYGRIRKTCIPPSHSPPSRHPITHSISSFSPSCSCRDSFDETAPEPRRCVPQARQATLPSPTYRVPILYLCQIHGLLSRGAATADHIFPGIVDEWLEHGAVKMDTVRDMHMTIKGEPCSARRQGLLSRI